MKNHIFTLLGRHLPFGPATQAGPACLRAAPRPFAAPTPDRRQSAHAAWRPCADEHATRHHRPAHVPTVPALPSRLSHRTLAPHSTHSTCSLPLAAAAGSDSSAAQRRSAIRRRVPPQPPHHSPPSRATSTATSRTTLPTSSPHELTGGEAQSNVFLLAGAQPQRTPPWLALLRLPLFLLSRTPCPPRNGEARLRVDVAAPATHAPE